MSTWRYVQNGQPSAPLDTAALQTLLSNGTLSPDTYVWRDGMTNWLAAKSVPELAASCSAMPPLPGATAAAPPPFTASTTDDIDKSRAFAILAYFWILFLVALIAAPQSKFAKYHANQDLILFIATIIGAVGCKILGYFPFINFLLLVIVPVFWGGWLVLAVLGVVNAAGGQCKPLPLIGHYQLIK